jgi:hypothetical protein
VTDFVEAMAFAMWKEDAVRAAPNVARYRTPDVFAMQAEPVRDRWRGLARAALHAIADAVPQDVSVMAAALRYEKFTEAADMLEALTVKAAHPKPSVAPLRLSAGGPDQRPILGQRGVGLRAEPQVLELHTVDREEPIRVAVPDGEGFCRKCGAPMAEGIAMGQTYVGGMPDFPGDDHSSTFSAGGPGEVIRALKCTACGWSVT